MAQKLKSICNSSLTRKTLLTLVGVFSLSLSSCNTHKMYGDTYFLYDTYVDVTYYDFDEQSIGDVFDILAKYNDLADNYKEIRSINNIATINKSNDKIEIDKALYDLLARSFELKEITNGYFNPLIGGLSNLWKNSLKNSQIPNENLILEEINKMNSSSIVLSNDEENKYYVQRIGDGLIDLGAITKGYVMDLISSYLKGSNNTSYIVNAGKSSILLGEKFNDTGLFNLTINDVAKNAYISCKNTIVTTSGVSERGKTIDGVTYSHIVNPFTGSAVNNYDMAYIIGNEGALCDALSTTFMMLDLETIKKYAEQYDLEILLYKNSKIVYKSDGFEVKYH